MPQGRSFKRERLVTCIVIPGRVAAISWRGESNTILRQAIRMAMYCLACATLCMALRGLAVAQEPDAASREDEQARRQAERAKSLTPMVSNKGERAIITLEDTGLLGTPPRGPYPWAGSVLGGGGVSVGGGYRFAFADDGSANFIAGWSVKSYKLLQSNLKFPSFADRRIHTSINAKWIDAPKVSFYGLGNDSKKGDKTSYLYRPTRVGATLGVDLTKWFSIGGGADFLNVHTGRGQLGTSIEEVFTPLTTPGLGAETNYAVVRAIAAIDWRDSPFYARRGGLYSFEWANYLQFDGSNYNFGQFDADLQQFIPLFRENWVLVLRGATSMTSTGGNNRVPYFLMPYLGSGETLRGFQDRRFRDRNSLLLQAEYRWTPSHFVDMALFADTGKLAARHSDLNFDGLHTDYGIGIRFHGLKSNGLRIDLARGNEGFNLVLSTGLF